MGYTVHFFQLQNAVCFIILTYLVPVLFTFYIQSVLKLKNNSGAKRLTTGLKKDVHFCAVWKILIVARTSFPGALNYALRRYLGPNSLSVERHYAVFFPLAR